MVLADTHVHLNHERLAPDLAAVLERARQAGVGLMVCVGWDLSSSGEALRLAGSLPNVRAAVGVHPHDAAVAPPDYLEQLRVLARRPGAAAIGEAGLDYYRDLSPRDVQQEVFRAQMRLAREVGLPLIVHCRDAQADTLALLEAEGPPLAVLHCFSGDRAVAARYVEMGYYLGFGGTLTYRRNEELRRVAREVPLEKILLETDAPYLPPEPRRGRRNEPACVLLVAQALAEIRGITVEEVAEATTANARRVFGYC
ncbi:MAG TPA: hydrolase TatD [Peptococcaceae bacterium]|nr:hydrolase TatD [Peptococcaceae bacterium]